MSSRKQTPDVLGEILSGEISLPELAAPPTSEPAPDISPRQPTSKATERSPKPEKLDKWEYLLVSCQDYHGWRPRYVNGIEICGWMKGPLIHDYLEQRGEEGWELVAASAGKPMFAITDAYQLFFKRPKK